MDQKLTDVGHTCGHLTQESEGSLTLNAGAFPKQPGILTVMWGGMVPN